MGGNESELHTIPDWRTCAFCSLIALMSDGDPIPEWWCTVALATLHNIGGLAMNAKVNTPYVPREVEIEISGECPLDCTYCRQHQASEGSAMSFQELCAILETLHGLGTELVCITGGEPLTNPRAVDLVKKSVGLGLQTALYTSGVAMSSALVAELQSIGLAMAFVTLLGPTPEVHNRITRRNSYKRTLQTIRNLVESDIRVTIHLPLLLANYRHVEAAIDLCLMLNVDQIHLIRYFPHDLLAGNEEVHEHLLTPLQLREVVDRTIAKIQDCQGQVTFIPGSTIPFALVDHSSITPSPCTAGTSRLYITYSGYVIPCPGFRESDLLTDDNNLRSRTLEDIWHNSRVMNMLRARSLDTLKGKCTMCDARASCQGGCPAQSYIYYRDISRPDPLCWRVPSSR